MDRSQLKELYFHQKLSMAQIAESLGCSINRVVYYMNKYGFVRRSIGDAVYQRNNPHGDPFSVKQIKTVEDAWLAGLGVGLFWGEGNKVNKWSIRLGNTDADLLRTFIKFLCQMLTVDKSKLRFELQIFTDIDPDAALQYWTKALGVAPSQFGRPTVTISGSIGTYRRKSKYGVVTVVFHNRKLRDILIDMLPR